MFQHVYLAPHYDDASLSCGGAIRRQSEAGEPVLVVTVCAASPPAHEPLSPFATNLHEQWGNPEDMVKLRRSEDQTSMEILGADYVRLDFTDCIYRGQAAQGVWHYNDNTAIFGKPQATDLSIIPELLAALLLMVPYEAGMTLYAPLTVGHHVDHQLVHAAARQLKQHGWQLLFYEDYPYTDPTSDSYNPLYNLETTLTRLEGLKLHPQIQSISAPNLQAKIESIGAYQSQLNVLFGGAEAMAAQVRDYALKVGEGSPAERIWLPG